MKDENGSPLAATTEDIAKTRLEKQVALLNEAFEKVSLDNVIKAVAEKLK